MTMSNLHPGFILIAVGLIALFVPKSLRRPVLAAGPLLGLGAVLTLAPGTNATLPFINGITAAAGDNQICRLRDLDTVDLIDEFAGFLMCFYIITGKNL